MSLHDKLYGSTEKDALQNVSPMRLLEYHREMKKTEQRLKHAETLLSKVFRITVEQGIVLGRTVDGNYWVLSDWREQKGPILYLTLDGHWKEESRVTGWAGDICWNSPLEAYEMFLRVEAEKGETK